MGTRKHKGISLWSDSRQLKSGAESSKQLLPDSKAVTVAPNCVWSCQVVPNLEKNFCEDGYEGACNGRRTRLSALLRGRSAFAELRFVATRGRGEDEVPSSKFQVPIPALAHGRAWSCQVVFRGRESSELFGGIWRYLEEFGVQFCGGGHSPQSTVRSRVEPSRTGSHRVVPIFVYEDGGCFERKQIDVPNEPANLPT
jgi:hypothetical protein